ncbi:hypothetical protein E2C01_090981 [Portunus trituberculatus]|uniref:Uncharacterized protein n=1 Tax=Portunus trituberculatus TaxID=210409 RepID=A0A5B7JMB6_PORTR|nr:hypothetical protein [Portunus trituberculatus]
MSWLRGTPARPHRSAQHRWEAGWRWSLALPREGQLPEAAARPILGILHESPAAGGCQSARISVGRCH